MGDKERAVYQTHQHLIVLLQRIVGWLFAFSVYLGLGLAVFFLGEDKARFTIGLVALGSLIMPLYLIIAAWVRGVRGREFLEHLWKPALAGVLILTVALVMMFRPETRPIGWVAVVLAVAPLAEAVRTFLDWLNERYLITNRRVVQIRGIINKEISDSALEKVNDVKMRQSIVGRILGYGTVEIITGSDIGVNLFHRISNPVRFKRAMLNAKEQLHAETPDDRPSEQAPASDLPPIPALSQSESSSPPEARITDLIAELAELCQKGVLSEEEFQAKKKELLDRL
jgi:predicted MPP superfamily phosphohydrolase